MSELKLTTDSYTYQELRQKYNNFHSPAVEIIIGGKKLVADLAAAVTKVTVNSSLDGKADTFSFAVSNAFDPIEWEFRWVDDYLVPGKEVEIRMGYGSELAPLFYGHITAVSFTCEDNPTITVKGMDKSFLMMTDNKSTSWDKKKYSEVVNEIAKKYGLNAHVDDTAQPIAKIAKTEQHSDFHFLNHLAKICNFDFFIIGKHLYFRKPLTSTSPVLTLEWGTSLRSFSVDVNIASQAASYTVRSMEPNKTELKEAKAASSDVGKLGKNAKTGADLLNAIGSYFDKYESTKKMESAEERKAVAQAKLNKLAMNLLSGSCEAVGIPEIRAGRYIALGGMGKKLSQPYYITSVTHSVDGSSGYVTTFQVKGNTI
ncbi:phage late control D family protein [Brevibacillus borstelensis]|uniref:phage late control D family protein n=1 Tax=Brevibacillus borstelensis TaxID=45462 RepID=UPI0030BB2D7B